ncbi:MAG: exodeoxyribonuclease III [Rhodobacteraceae bacterium]|nr:exodeoxyribonuclease III [Paracoccaceae bacterium]
MKIASFNINGIKARLPRLLEWLEESKVDVALLQEIKSIDANFPRQEIEDLGYNIATHGQKSFNGVAILSKYPIEDLVCGLPGDAEDEQARWIEASINNVRICGLYLPNGNPVPGPKFDYKLAWMERMFSRAKDILKSEEIALMAGDYNIIPQPEDCHDPDVWWGDALYRPESLSAYRKILNLGFTEAFRALHAAPMNYTFWDFQAGAWNRNNGIRIDHFLLTPQAADCLTACEIDRDMRGRERPSDHVPIWIELDI